MREKKKNMSKWTYWFLLAIAIILVYKFLDNFVVIKNIIGNFFGVIAPFLSGALLAYLLYIPESRLENKIGKCKKKFIRKKAKGISVLLTYLIVAMLIIIMVNVIIPVLKDSIFELLSNLENYWNIANTRINELPETSFLKSEEVKNIIKRIGESIQNFDFNKYFSSERIFGYIKSALGFATGIFDVFVTIVVSVYMLMQRIQIVNFFKKIGLAFLEEKTCYKIGEYVNKSNRIFYKFISSQLLDAVIVGILVTIAMKIIGVKYAFLLGFMIGLFNIIPYFGAIIAVAISILITLITGGFSQALIMAIVVIILQQIDSNIINPKITGNSVEISPLLVIFAVSVGGAYFGVLGMFLAVPIIAIIKILLNDLINYKINKKIENKEI